MCIYGVAGNSFVGYVTANSGKILQLSLEHCLLVVVAVLIAIVVGISLGILISYYDVLAPAILYVCQIIMTIPSLALFGLFLPLFGIGFKTGVITLVLYCLLPVVRNTYVGIAEIDPSIIEAARGMGMNEASIMTKIKLPLAWPIIMAGIRTAVVMVVGIAAIASVVGAGGLGVFIFRGISQWNINAVLVGAIFVSLLAIVFDQVLKLVENRSQV
ncbi:MetI-like domain [Syntrophomonas zehnderi OL-4]|uniref:MetI-like domain n=1 Tax=Syntrophomonas zehnderi OL-4 TaxID=690567 RepID=A0A0E3W316_9FIRM|nr:ABC transporter permease [Syntrophomonas zehnderi]CFX40363.1 MetI-like domain [Syntrophomonas zehnderi OL-4]